MPDLLAGDALEEWLDGEVAADDSLRRLVRRAERKVIDRYRQKKHGSDPPLDSFRSTAHLRPVRLEGWKETDDGTPDVDAMPDDLVRRLRDVIARIVTHWANAPDSDVESVSQGSKSVSYSKDAGHLPRSVWEPLRPYDDRTPYAPGL